MTCTCGRSIAEPYGDKGAYSWRSRNKKGDHLAYLAMYVPPEFPEAKSTTAHCPGGDCGDRLYFLADGTPAVERRASRRRRPAPMSEQAETCTCKRCVGNRIPGKWATGANPVDAANCHCPDCGDRLCFLADGTPAVERRARLVRQKEMLLHALMLAASRLEAAIDEHRAEAEDSRCLMTLHAALAAADREAAPQEPPCPS